MKYGDIGSLIAATTRGMESRLIMVATIKLGLLVSTIAVLLTLALDRVGDVSAGPLMAAVAVAGFGLSWAQTSRLSRRPGPAISRHPVALARHAA